MRSVTTRLSLSFATYVVLLVSVVLATGYVLRRQHDDGLVVNLSGRQRMLTQRMTHQLFTYATMVDTGADVTDARQRVATTMRVFESTLDALENGGPAPVDLQMASFRDCPPASSVVGQRLAIVRRTYGMYKRAAEDVLRGDAGGRTAGIASIRAMESELLAEMDAAVTLLQGEAEAKVTELFKIQGLALFLSVLLTWLLLRWVRAGVTQPLERLREAAEEMSLGNLHKAVPVTGSPELRSLAQSIDRLRTSLRALMDGRKADPVASEMADW
jgi:methyl-accepting chemotaxis protein